MFDFIKYYLKPNHIVLKFLNKASTLKDIIYVSIYIIIGVLVIAKGAIYYPDSYTFIDMALNHSPGYCSFIKIFTFIFGSSFELPLVIAQYIIIVLGINFFIKTLKKIYNIHLTGFFIIQLVCLGPCVYVHNLGSTILSEALTFPIFLIIFALTLKLFIEENLNYVYKIGISLFFLILIRGQFLALIPVLAFIIVYITIKNQSFYKNFYFLGFIILVPILTSLSERGYNKLVFGYFINNSMNYIHFITSPFYIAKASDVEIFNSDEEKVYFNLVYDSLKEAELTRNQNLDQNIGDYMFYQNNFPKICNRRVYDLGLSYYKAKGLNYVDRSIALNKLCSKMIFPLIRKNFKIWIRLFVKNTINSFDSSKHILFFFILLFYGFWGLIKTNKNIYKFIVLSTLFMFANNILIALVVHSISRYTFYFDWFLITVFIILFNEIFKNHRIHES